VRPPVFRLEVKNVNKQFGPFRCLNNISLHLAAGEAVAVVGTNASGKTTLLDILSGFIAPDGGTVLLDGIAASGRSALWFAKRGVLRTFQSPRAFEQMSVADCLRLACQIPSAPGIIDAIVRSVRYRKAEEESEVRTTAALELMGWASLADNQVRTLSYGQRKLLAVAQLFLAAGTVALCDEPTSGLDSQLAVVAMDLLSRWQSQGTSRALMVATHEFDYASMSFDQAYRLERGVLCEA
jgi:ABC-type branched-subunit amino acid transport system ATPase component